MCGHVIDQCSEEHSAGWYVSASLQKALCIMFAALRKSYSSSVSQPVGPGLIEGLVIMKSQFVNDLMLCH